MRFQAIRHRLTSDTWTITSLPGLTSLHIVPCRACRLSRQAIQTLTRSAMHAPQLSVRSRS